MRWSPKCQVSFLKIYSSNPFFNFNSISYTFLHSLGTCSIFTAYLYGIIIVEVWNKNRSLLLALINATMRGRLVWKSSQLYKFPVDFSILRSATNLDDSRRYAQLDEWDTHGASAEESIILVYFKFHTSKFAYTRESSLLFIILICAELHSTVKLRVYKLRNFDCQTRELLISSLSLSLSYRSRVGCVGSESV